MKRSMNQKGVFTATAVNLNHANYGNMPMSTALTGNDSILTKENRIGK